MTPPGSARTVELIDNDIQPFYASFRVIQPVLKTLDFLPVSAPVKLEGVLCIPPTRCEPVVAAKVACHDLKLQNLHVQLYMSTHVLPLMFIPLPNFAFVCQTDKP